MPRSDRTTEGPPTPGNTTRCPAISGENETFHIFAPVLKQGLPAARQIGFQPFPYLIPKTCFFWCQIEIHTILRPNAQIEFESTV